MGAETDIAAQRDASVKYFPLVWAGLWRRPTRTVLTALCILLAFMLLGLLQGVNAGFEHAIASAHRESLITRTRVRGGAPMPIAAIPAIRSVPGVLEVAPRAYFMGTYGNPSANDTVVALATRADTFFRVITGLRASPAAIRALDGDRMGMLATTPLLKYWAWKVGDRVSLRTALPKKDGSQDWTFDIVGSIDAPDAQTANYYFGIINYDYFNDNRTRDQNTAEIFYVRIANPERSVATSAAIDRIFANSSHETRTRSQQAGAELQSKQMGDVELFTHCIIGAVLFTLAFLTGNTLRQALQERAREFAVLKATGYSNRGILYLAFSEALFLYLPPAILGLFAAQLVAPLAREDVGVILVSPGVCVLGLSCAIGLAFLGAALPASRLARMSVATAFARAGPG
ncbi:MAG TPA: ABC transporter permease [Steroidobacteraceae bacterium]|nr:ABC transporter permease [Steroidobacteraceae bacterium]